MYTAKQAVAMVSEGLECFGGQGYIEGTGLPGMFRDAQVLPIWEGTSNVMSLDVLRCLNKSGGEALRVLVSHVRQTAAQTGLANDQELQKAGEALTAAAANIEKWAKRADPSIFELAARDLTVSLANIYVGSLLAEQAAVSANKSDMATLKQWVYGRTLAPILVNHSVGDYEKSLTDQQEFVFEGYRR
jgi:hypothetical protein